VEDQPARLLFHNYGDSMEKTMHLQWLTWVQRLQAIAQNGLTFANNPFDQERYESIRTIAAEIAATHTAEDMLYVRQLFAREVGYATPKVDVRGVVLCHQAILLVREREDNRWTLPGGWVDVWESPSTAVVREVYEESGYHTRAVKLLALYDKNQHAHPPSPYHVYKLFFQCELMGGDPSHSKETDGVAFFQVDTLPPLSLTRVLPTQISRLFELSQHPEWPTEFD
jgi:ADP-ribose pyrophosphatase YjhB (NUDIX family)